MICSCCEREIHEGEQFYFKYGELYCSQCTTEKPITIYVFADGSEEMEDEVKVFKSKKEYEEWTQEEKWYVGGENK